MSSGAPATPEKVDIRKYLLILKRRKWWGLVPFLLLLAGFTVVTLALPERYLSTCVIKASKSEVASMLGTRGRETAEPKRSSKIVEEELLRYDRVTQALAGTKVMTDLDDEAGGDPREYARLLERLYNKIVKNTRIQPVGDILINISHLGSRPDEAKIILDRLTNYFVERALEKERTDATRARDIAQGRLDSARRDIETLDKKLREFRENHPGIFAESEGSRQNDLEITKRELNRLDLEIDAMQRKLDRYNEQLDNMPKQIPTATTPVLNPTVSLLKQRLAELRTARAVNLKIFTPLHPDVVALQQRIEATEEQLARAQEEAAAEEPEVGIEPNPLYQQLEEKKLEQEAMLEYQRDARRTLMLRERQLTQELRARPQLQQEMEQLMRERSSAAETYSKELDDFLRIQKDFSITMEGLISFNIIAPAREPHEPDIAHKLKLALAGLFVSVAAAVGAIAGMEFLDQSFTDVETARHVLRLPSLGVIPYIETESDRRTRRRHYLLIPSIAVAVILVVVLTIILVPSVASVANHIWGIVRHLCRNLA